MYNFECNRSPPCFFIDIMLYMNHIPIEVHEVIFTLNAHPDYAISFVHGRLDLKEEEKSLSSSIL